MVRNKGDGILKIRYRTQQNIHSYSYEFLQKNAIFTVFTEKQMTRTPSIEMLLRSTSDEAVSPQESVERGRIRQADGEQHEAVCQEEQAKSVS